MITYDHIMVRFGELSTKGKNKKDFIKTLAVNIRFALKDFPLLKIETRYDHIYVALNGTDYQPVILRLQDISGIHSLSLVYKCSRDMEEMKQAALNLIKEEKGQTFKIKCKRSDKKYPLVSEQITREIAGHILRSITLKVDVHQPDIMLSIEVREEATYIFCHTFLGAGGYPLGVGGKSMHMLSGGIDSPVAAFLMMKRGVMIECIHFASPPYTQAGVIYKLEDLLHTLNKYQPRIRLHIIPFTKIQEAIYDNADESYCITVMRRMMFRLADRLAKRRKCPVISSGESIGQVASQTLQSMHVINEVTNMPILRPCATMDKTEIIEISRKIGTYDISIRPYEDCCTIFTPKAPKTSPRLDQVLTFEGKFDYETLIREALQNVETKILAFDDEKTEGIL
ncbi:MAG: tRNA 4-thiouridine(8) synthase ThiI [Bacilli bacterium]|jgi:tRNA uracil 4-sulfurtransferase|nr:tRNA 4-thiouridine(8) synthase ThiI [Bacilli bacterium]MDD3068670.1 tRNA 4-thiouridine(8) synthase ThiI [Bacilli bacterium]MDD3841741.1 tRNA 4-thiouridine(8) synthase ThiI [Bacilli bacterium]HKM10278.1 tRNA uracil 4-sulfurtransferase ThiI [Bacilli bacterium]